ncbi:sugar transferase [Knoellia sp. CPCC 206453]|uniref:sugar transferase n=1 Tax=Knoellia pratensis TaxID=3404796 RepID=UPI00361A7ABD
MKDQQSAEAGAVEVGLLLPGTKPRRDGPSRWRTWSLKGYRVDPTSQTPLGWPSAYRQRLVLGDLMCALVASTTASVMRLGRVPDSIVVLIYLTPLAWALAVRLLQGYQGRHLGQGAQEYRVVLWAGAVLLGVAGFTSYAFTLELARGYVFLVVPLVVGLSLVLRKGLRLWLSRARSHGRYRQRTVVVGTAKSAGELIRELRRSPSNSFDLVGACVSGAKHSVAVEGVPVTGRPRDVTLAVDFSDAALVAVSGHPGLTGQELRELAWELEERHVDLVISPGIFEVAGPRLSIRAEAGVSLLHLERPVRSGSRMVVKRVQDLALAVVITLFALPFLLLIALAVRLDSEGPILFHQKRIGQSGQEFRIYKFRTMVVDAEAKLKALADSGHEVNAVLFKSRVDPRVTRVGRWLRRFSIDEVPQLLNVLRGEMSLVGPRPGLASEVDHYEPDAMRRLRVRPGMTGLWQVSGRSTLNWEQTVRLDLWYVDNWSTTLDLQILIRTARAVIGGRGAF